MSCELHMYHRPKSLTGCTVSRVFDTVMVMLAVYIVFGWALTLAAPQSVWFDFFLTLALASLLMPFLALLRAFGRSRG